MSFKTTKNISVIHLIFSCLIVLLYFVGFIFKEYVPGGSPEDFSAFVWKNINSFKDNFYYSLINYNEMADANFPGFYIISSLNPFSHSVETFHLFSLMIGFFTFIVFAFLLSLNDNSNSKTINFALASLILILPFFISRNYWGTSGGLAWFVFILCLFYFQIIKNKIENNVTVSLHNIFVLCLLTSILLYIRASYVFLALYIVLYFLLIVKKNKITIPILLFYFICSLPGLYLIYMWSHSTGDDINALKFINFKNILLNFPILSSYFTFYLFPLLVIGIKFITKKTLIKYLKIFFLFFIFYLFLFLFNKFEYLGSYNYGGGAILKLNYILIKNNYFLLLLSSLIGCCLLYAFLEKNFLENIILIIPILLIYGLTNYPFQDYFEPLIIFLFFTGMIKCSFYSFFVKNKKIIFYFYSFYFISFLTASIFIKNFV